MFRKMVAALVGLWWRAERVLFPVYPAPGLRSCHLCGRAVFRRCVMCFPPQPETENEMIGDDASQLKPRAVLTAEQRESLKAAVRESYRNGEPTAAVPLVVDATEGEFTGRVVTHGKPVGRTMTPEQAAEYFADHLNDCPDALDVFIRREGSTLVVPDEEGNPQRFELSAVVPRPSVPELHDSLPPLGVDWSPADLAKTLAVFWNLGLKYPENPGQRMEQDGATVTLLDTAGKPQRFRLVREFPELGSDS